MQSDLLVAIDLHHSSGSQCPDYACNLVDLNRIEADVRRFVRYNRSLDRAYRKALEKERAREQTLLGELRLTAIKHFVVSRYPVATQNPCVLAFGEISRFRAIAVGT